MDDGSIDPASLEGDALARWYLRSPADIEQKRQAVAARRYKDFFYETSGVDRGPGFDREVPASDKDVDPGFATALPSSQDVDPKFTWVPAGPNRWRSVRIANDLQAAGSTLPELPASNAPVPNDPRAILPGLADPGIDAWMTARNSELETRPDAAAAGREAWEQATRNGEGLQASRPSDLTMIGLRGLSRGQDGPVASASELNVAPQRISQTAEELKSPPTVAFGRSPMGASSPGIGSAAIPRVRSSAEPVRAQIASAATPANPPSHQARTITAAVRPRSSVGHPGFAESLIPVWGSGREAVADFQEGDYAGAALNGALSVSDLFLAESIAKGLAKGGFYVAKNVAKKAPYDWKEVVRPWMGKQGFLEFGQHGHHWAIPQNGWGKQIPDAIKNQPWNIKPMPSPEVHGRLTGSYKGKPQFNVAERYWYGTPAWSKVGTAAAVGHPLAAAKAQSDQRK